MGLYARQTDKIIWQRDLAWENIDWNMDGIGRKIKEKLIKLRGMHMEDGRNNALEGPRVTQAQYMFVRTGRDVLHGQRRIFGQRRIPSYPVMVDLQLYSVLNFPAGYSVALTTPGLFDNVGHARPFWQRKPRHARYFWKVGIFSPVTLSPSLRQAFLTTLATPGLFDNVGHARPFWQRKPRHARSFWKVGPQLYLFIYLCFSLQIVLIKKKHLLPPGAPYIHIPLI